MASSPFPRRPTAATFSLVEILLVLVLMAFLLAMAVPTLRGSLQASSVNASASMVAQEIRLARQYAVAHAAYIAVLMPTAEDYHKGGVDPTSYKASSIRTCVLTGAPTEMHDGTNSWYQGTFASYIPDSSWQFTTSGTYIGYTSNFGTFTQDPDGAVLTDHSCNTVSSVLFPSSTSATSVDNMRALIFRPNGTVVPSPDNNGAMSVDPSPLIRVGSGLIRGGDQLLRVDNNFLMMQVNRFTGRVKFVEGLE